MSTKHRIYLDYASTTPVDPAVEKEMRRFFGVFGNPSSIHAEGNAARLALVDCRTRIARQIEAHADEIIFTSGGTESNNLALLGAVQAVVDNGSSWRDIRIVTTKLEHASVLSVFDELKSRGAIVEYAPVSEEGLVRLADLERLVSEKTTLVSIQYVNSEIGVIQPMRKIAQIIERAKKGAAGKAFRATGPLFHVDASQAPLYLNVTQHFLGADLITFDAQKIYGPKGVGCLYVRRGTVLAPLVFGGGQEKSLRPGTENLPAIAGFAKAFELAAAAREKESERLRQLRDYGINILRAAIPGIEFNGSLQERVPNNINVSISGLESEFAVLQLDARGFAVSSKSACDASELLSPTILALGRGEDAARSSLRFTLGRDSKRSDLDKLARALVEIVPKH